jgi:sulfur-carrier protein adenylyltransferase/sulfurtransferase
VAGERRARLIAAMNDRYARQTILPQVGALGQQRLAAARVLVVGAGGLGCAVLPYLTAAGVGQLTVVDHDRVEESNLQRQPLYRMSDLNTFKAESACRALAQLNPHVRLQPLLERLTAANAGALVRAADLVIDAADSFAVTYILSDSCQAGRVPLISASVLGLSGYVGAFCGGAPSYRAVFPDLPQTAGSCAEAGVLGTAVGVIGTLQAHLALGVLIGWQPSPLGRLVSLDLRTLHLSGFSFSQAGEPLAQSLAFIAPADVVADDVVVDLRSRSEAPQSPFAGALRLDVAALEADADALPSSGRVVLCCRSGLRAWRAARALQRQGRDNLVLLALGE